MKLNATPATADPGAEIVRNAVCPATTVMAPELPCIDVTVSFTVMYLMPDAFSVAEKVPVPLLSVVSAGRIEVGKL